MKLFKEDSIKKVEKEIEALKHLRGGPNIIEFIDAVQGDSVRNLSVRYCRQ
jgi:serine/threonine protein kinase